MARIKDFKISTRLIDTTRNLSRYYSDVNKQYRLSAEEEANLAVLARKGDQKAREKIINSNLRFAISVAKFYANPKCPLEDLISEANKGLVEAIEKYDPSTGFKFITYAVWHIRKNILYYIANFSGPIRIPIHVQLSLKNYQKAFDIFVQKNSREPNLEEVENLLKVFNMSPLLPNAKAVIKNKPEVIPFDPITDNSNDGLKMTPINYIQSESNTEYSIEELEKKEKIKNIISFLRPRERDVINLKYGLIDGNCLTYKEIAKKFNKTREWARQVATKAEKRMRLNRIKNKLKNL